MARQKPTLPITKQVISKTTGKLVDAKRSRAAIKAAATRKLRAEQIQTKRALRLHHKILIIGAVIGVLLITFLGIRSQLQTYAAGAATGTFTGLAGKCLDNQHSVTSNHNQVQLYHCNGTNAQKWTYASNGSLISSNGDGSYCLDVKYNSPVQYTYLQLYKCNGTTAQAFLLTGDRIINKATGLCVTVKDGASADSTRLWTMRCDGEASQKWVFGGTTTTESGSSQGTPTPSPTPPPTPAPTPAPSSGSLLFDDEFNGSANATPDASKWQIMGGTSPSRWGVECFVNDRSHIKLDGQGHLIETATYNPSGVPCKNGSGPYESGGMTTGSAIGGLFSYKYGTAEARIQVSCQSGTGIWDGWWADGPNWPNGGEIDFLEVMKGGHQGYSAVQTLHGPNSSGGSWQTPYTTTASTLWCKDFHTYGAIWSPQKIQFTIDGNVTRVFTPSSLPSGAKWPFDSAAERLLIDLQVGAWGGTPNPTTFPQSMVVDYVRVYK